MKKMTGVGGEWNEREVKKTRGTREKHALALLSMTSMILRFKEDPDTGGYILNHRDDSYWVGGAQQHNRLP
jgi:hypothetical protein